MVCWDLAKKNKKACWEVRSQVKRRGTFFLTGEDQKFEPHIFPLKTTLGISFVTRLLASKTEKHFGDTSLSRT